MIDSKLTAKAKCSADNIIRKYLSGDYGRDEAHEALNELNRTCFAIYDFELAVIKPGELQDYIHDLQNRYTCYDAVQEEAGA